MNMANRYTICLFLLFIASLLLLDLSSAKKWKTKGKRSVVTDKVQLIATTSNNQQSQNAPVAQKKGLFAPLNLSRVFQSALQLFISDVDVLKLVSKGCAMTVYLALALSVAGSLGYDTKPVLGLASVVFLSLGIGAKDIVSNTFAGLFVAFARPFRRNSKITIHSPSGMTFSGRVLSIDMRYLRLQESAKQGTTLIPLNFCLNKPITVEEL